MGLPFPTRETCVGSLLYKGKRWLGSIRKDRGRKLHLLSGKSHGIIPNTRQTWVQIAGIGQHQQDLIIGFPVADVLDEKNASESPREVALEGVDDFRFVSDWVSR